MGRAPKRQQKNRTLRVQRSSAPMRRTHRVPLTHHANGPQSGQGRAQALGQLGELRGVKQPQFSTQHPSPPNWVTSTHAATHCPQGPVESTPPPDTAPNVGTATQPMRHAHARSALTLCTPAHQPTVRHHRMYHAPRPVGGGGRAASRRSTADILVQPSGNSKSDGRRAAGSWAASSYE